MADEAADRHGVVGGGGEAKKESWKALLVVGLLFPLHLVLGLLVAPLVGWWLWSGSWVAALLVAAYLPLYLYPAQYHYPGWKGWDAMWDLLDYSTTCPSYFGQFQVHGGEGIDSREQYLMACHPHGTVIFQRAFWRTRQLEGLFDRPWRMLAASALFRIPLVREISLLFGAVDCSRATACRMLSAGANVVVWPGGLDEANAVGGDGGPVLLRSRTGFVRLAVEHGVRVLPVFVFGELDAVSAVSPFPAPLRAFLRRSLRMSSAVFVGRWLSFVPRRVPFHLCFGAPISVARLPASSPSFDAEVARVHAAYKAQIKAVYAANAPLYGYAHRPLSFVCEAPGFQSESQPSIPSSLTSSSSPSPIPS